MGKVRRTRYILECNGKKSITYVELSHSPQFEFSREKDRGSHEYFLQQCSRYINKKFQALVIYDETQDLRKQTPKTKANIIIDSMNMEENFRRKKWKQSTNIAIGKRPSCSLQDGDQNHLIEVRQLTIG